ncbi:phage protein [Achromobacter aloeverae]
MARFDRVYRLLVGKAGQKGVEINQPMRITFEIEKSAEEDPNDSKIRVYNLATATRKAMEQPDLRCLLYAGYAEEGGPLLMMAGAVTFGYTFFDGPDVVTELSVKDGYVEIRDTAVSLGYGPGAQASVIIRDIARQMGLPLVMAADVPDRRWEHGFSFYGAARAALHKVVQGTSLEWSIQNQQLQVIPRRGTTRRQAVVLAADTGLIGYPERTREAAREKAKVKDQRTGDSVNLVSAKPQRDGWRVTSLLLPQINPGDLVKLESRSVSDFLRVESLRHNGDSYDGDWQTELQLVDRNAPPKKKTGS